MTTGLNIDLHMHTTASDGTDAPEDILARVKAAGIGVFAVTDHDTVKGARTVRSLWRPGDPRFIAGVEFSCEDENGKYHILGYGFGLGDGEVTRLADYCHACRIEKLRLRLDALRERYGFEFSEASRAALFTLDNPGKPHLGNLMMAYGYAASKDEAIRRYINPLPVPEDHVRPERAIEATRADGGVPILAHPWFGNGDQHIPGEAMEARLERLSAMGLMGVEACYSTFDAAQREQMLALAEKRRLYVTAGSDYHGGNKRIRLGDTGLEALGRVPEGLRRFLERVGR